jgi:DHA1 family bicyclomycin/chloramphenicol resistance-like MFS transporter
MQTQTRLPFLTLLLLISFATVNAVLFTPALPQIAAFFAISNQQAQHTMMWFLVGYTIGQLLYGPIANRYGRKPALYIGISLQIMSCAICIVAVKIQQFDLLLMGRFLMALGSGVGLKMTFTLVNECYQSKQASSKIAHLMLSFAITPGLGIALGGYLTAHFGWLSCFYLLGFYGIALLFATATLPETLKETDHHSFKLKHLIENYGVQFKNTRLLTSGFLMGISTCFIYLFAAAGPFIAINFYKMNSVQYGIANILPSIGMFIGSLFASWAAKKYPLKLLINRGIWIIFCGSLVMMIGILSSMSILLALFVPMLIIYFGLCFIFSNASTIAMQNIDDKAHSSAVMSFLNMGTATLAVLSLGFFHLSESLLPTMFLMLGGIMFVLYMASVSKVEA